MAAGSRSNDLMRIETAAELSEFAQAVLFSLTTIHGRGGGRLDAPLQCNLRTPFSITDSAVPAVDDVGRYR
jgi:hypothetical protein